MSRLLIVPCACLARPESCPVYVLSTVPRLSRDRPTNTPIPPGLGTPYFGADPKHTQLAQNQRVSGYVSSSANKNHSNDVMEQAFGS